MVCKKDGIPRRSVRKAAGRRKRFCPPEEPECWEGFTRRIISDASARRPSMSRTPSMEKNFISIRNSA